LLINAKSRQFLRFLLDFGKVARILLLQEAMNDQDSVTIVITVLLLLPWLGRAAVSLVAVWEEHMEVLHRTHHRVRLQ
jgi:hypothetical protein